MAITNEQVARFWDNAVPEPNTGCLLWMAGCFGTGYGAFGIGATGEIRPALAHRLALSLSGVNVPDDADVCHRCDTPLCVNPDHLFVGDALANMQDKVRKGRARSGGSYATHCKHGHEFTPANTMRSASRVGRQCRTCRQNRDRMAYAAAVAQS